ncbi:MAG: phosphate acetyltransferase [Planctomycetes bacterium]|nr:phosphate acetyltransferase [Planctomycetota bacterium]
MEIIDCCKEQIRGKGLSVVLPEGNDERIVQAARILKDDQLAEPILLGTDEKIAIATEKAGVNLDGIEIIHPKQSDRLDFYTEKYVERRQNMSPGAAKRLVGKPLFYGGMMVACGDAQTMVGGAAHATATMIQSGSLTVGMAAGINTVSSYFLMVVPEFQGTKHRPSIFADCAVNVDPTAEELADIALASAISAGKILDDAPRVALLSYSSKGSGSGESVDKVVKALELAKERQPEWAIDGEFQADSAIMPQVAAKKVKDESLVAGKANVLIFPDLNSGNIAYKLTQYLAGAQAIGPFLQGFATPIADLSRGASVEDIVSTSVLSLVQLL